MSEMVPPQNAQPPVVPVSPEPHPRSQAMIKSHRRENIRDFALVSVALLLLTAEVLYLLHEMKFIKLPLPWERGGNGGLQIGQIMDKKKMLRQRAQRSLSWFPVGEGDKLYLHDTLLTGPDSWARISINGEGEIDLEADTLVRFSEEPSAQQLAVLNLEIGQGIIRVKSQKKTVVVKLKSREISLTPDSEVVLSRPTLQVESQVQVKKGEVQVFQMADAPSTETSASGAKSGDPKLADASSSISLKAGDAMQITPGRRLARIETNLAIEPKYPMHKGRVSAKNALEPVGIFWSGDEGTEVELDTETDFLSPKKYRTSGRSAQLELPPGQYYWRIRRDVAVSPAYEFTVLPAVIYKLTFPSDGTAFKEGAPVTLRWEPVEGASHYFIEVSRTEDFKEFLMQSDSSETKSLFRDVKPGTYFWRVRAFHKALGNWPASTVHSFTVKRKLGAPKPKGAKVIPEKQSNYQAPRRGLFSDLLRMTTDWWLPEAVAENQSTLWLELSWEATEGAEAYRLEIYDNRALKDPIKVLVVPATVAIVELPRFENYYWRVAALDDDRVVHAFSEPQVMHAVQAKPTPPPAVIAGKIRNIFPEVKKKSEPERLVPSPLAREPAAVVVSNWPRWLPTGVGVGGGAVQRTQEDTAPDFASDHRGTMRAGHLLIYREIGPSELELSYTHRDTALYQESASGVRTGAKAVDLAAFDLRLRNAWTWGSWGISFGLNIRDELELYRLDGSSAEARVVRFHSGLAGISLSSGTARAFYWRNDLLGEFSPLSGARGVAALLRSRLGYVFSILPITPELSLGARRSLQWLNDGKKQTSLDFTASLILRVRFDS